MSKASPNSTLRSAGFWKRLTGIVLLGGVAVMAALYWQQNVRVHEVEVSGVYFSDANEIIRIADVPDGIKPDSLDLEALKNRVRSLDYVKDVVPYVEPSGDLRLDITEREPLALLISGAERVYVDEDGVKLNLLQGKIRNVPVVYGFNTNVGKDTLKSDEFIQVRDFLQQARENEFGWATISEVVFDPKDGVVALSHQNGVKLLFGRDEFMSKLQNWEAFYAQVIKTKGIEQMQQVDLRFVNQVVTRESDKKLAINK
ncbi:cell division protein FtsQ/DivIB [Balneola sp. MJW-20]|uniref:cell division protein FtsQ/DivIB n=1 Tax=Gracilimonas aurantiaca TaxID=3234185 RepID=UPI0034669C59